MDKLPCYEKTKGFPHFCVMMRAFHAVRWLNGWIKEHRCCSGVRMNREACVRLSWSLISLTVLEGSVLLSANRFSWLLNLLIIRRLCAFSLLHLWNMLACFFSAIFCENCNNFPFFRRHYGSTPLESNGPVYFEMLQRGFLVKLFIDILDGLSVFLSTTLASQSPAHPPPALPCRAPVCSRQLWVGGSWLRLEHSRGEVTPIIPWV